MMIHSLSVAARHPADTNSSGCVDTDDLVAVILGWGDCPIGTMCLADTDGNCVVDVDDLVNVNLEKSRQAPVIYQRLHVRARKVEKSKSQDEKSGKVRTGTN